MDTAMFNMDPMDLLFSEESSLWAARDDFFKADQEGAGLSGGSPTRTLADDLLDELDRQQSGELTPSEEFPGWMSEKISLTQWIDAADIMPTDLLTTVPLSFPKMETTSVDPAAEELLQMLMVDSRIPPQPPSPGEQQAPDLLTLSTADSLYSPDPSSPPPVSPTLSYSSSSPESPQSMTAEEQLLQIANGLTNFFSAGDDLHEPEGIDEIPEVSSPGSVDSPTQIPIKADPLPVDPTPRKKSRAKSKLKTVSDPSIKKHKKRDQNKEAATRYRQKKRAEANIISEEEDILEGRNKELNDKCDSLQREIKYLKELMVEVYKVKGELKILRK